MRIGAFQAHASNRERAFCSGQLRWLVGWDQSHGIDHAVTEKPETVLINPDEHVEYVQPIATRELTPDKVFTVEVFLPNYPELRIRQKFLTQQ